MWHQLWVGWSGESNTPSRSHWHVLGHIQALFRVTGPCASVTPGFYRGSSPREAGFAGWSSLTQAQSSGVPLLAPDSSRRGFNFTFWEGVQGPSAEEHMGWDIRLWPSVASERRPYIQAFPPVHCIWGSLRKGRLRGSDSESITKKTSGYEFPII